MGSMTRAAVLADIGDGAGELMDVHHPVTRKRRPARAWEQPCLPFQWPDSASAYMHGSPQGSPTGRSYPQKQRT
jgi:hypothetical protein